MTNDYTQSIISCHCPTPSFSLSCQQFPKLAALVWNVMFHPFSHISAFDLSSLLPLSSPSTPPDYTELQWLSRVGENIHPRPLPVSPAMHDWVPTSRGNCNPSSLPATSQPPHSPPLPLIPPPLSSTPHSSFSSSFSDRDASFSQENWCHQKSLSISLPQTLFPTCSCSNHTSLCPSEWTLSVNSLSFPGALDYPLAYLLKALTLATVPSSATPFFSPSNIVFPISI